VAEGVMLVGGATAGFRIATAGFDGTGVPHQEVAGELTEEVWQIPEAMPAALVTQLRAELAAQGYTAGFACADRGCGGFDFRTALPIPGGPAMHVDLGDFQYLTASRSGAGGTEHVVLTVSRGGGTGYVHLAHVAPAGAVPAAVTPSSRQTGETPDDGLIAQLAGAGHAVLEDLEFATGASALSGTRYESLVTLAAWLAEADGRRVVLVGHTDAEGPLQGNIDLSRARAESVRDWLVREAGADPARIEAYGVGYLAPRADNASPEGREANRRVEVVLIAP
jgi:OOP family OmpA-OmpF porin